MPLCAQFQGLGEYQPQGGFEGLFGPLSGLDQSAGRERKKGRQKAPTLYCAGALTSARSAGSFRGYGLTLFSLDADGNDAFS